jgi:hypothetical protein
MAPPPRKQWGQGSVGMGAEAKKQLQKQSSAKSSVPSDRGEGFEILISNRDMERIKQRQLREEEENNRKLHEIKAEAELSDYVSMIERILSNHKKPPESGQDSQQLFDDEETKETLLQEMALPGDVRRTEADLELE